MDKLYEQLEGYDPINWNDVEALELPAADEERKQ